MTLSVTPFLSYSILPRPGLFTLPGDAVFEICDAGLHTIQVLPISRDASRRPNGRAFRYLNFRHRSSAIDIFGQPERKSAGRRSMHKDAVSVMALGSEYDRANHPSNATTKQIRPVTSTSIVLKHPVVTGHLHSSYIILEDKPRVCYNHLQASTTRPGMELLPRQTFFQSILLRGVSHQK